MKALAKKPRFSAVQRRTLWESAENKWLGICLGYTADEGDVNCACCKKWYSYLGCDGCPVAEASGMPFCNGTPYIKWGEAYEEARSWGDITHPLPSLPQKAWKHKSIYIRRAYKAALAEYQYLIGLALEEI